MSVEQNFKNNLNRYMNHHKSRGTNQESIKWIVMSHVDDKVKLHNDALSFKRYEWSGRCSQCELWNSTPSNNISMYRNPSNGELFCNRCCSMPK
jgi:hypothetical protein